MAREITRTGYSTLGVLAGFVGLMSIGAASVAAQLDGVTWWVLAAVFVVAAASLFWAAVRLLLRGRLHPPDQTHGGRPPR
jgi:membrane protein implicated in regulation of membrane protease activity